MHNDRIFTRRDFIRRIGMTGGAGAAFAALDALSDDDLLANFHFRLKSGSGSNRQDVALMHRLHERVCALEAREGQG